MGVELDRTHLLLRLSSIPTSPFRQNSDHNIPTPQDWRTGSSPKSSTFWIDIDTHTHTRTRLHKIIWTAVHISAQEQYMENWNWICQHTLLRSANCTYFYLQILNSAYILSHTYIYSTFDIGMFYYFAAVVSSCHVTTLQKCCFAALH